MKQSNMNWILKCFRKNRDGGLSTIDTNFNNADTHGSRKANLIHTRINEMNRKLHKLDIEIKQVFDYSDNNNNQTKNNTEAGSLYVSDDNKHNTMLSINNKNNSTSTKEKDGILAVQSLLKNAGHNVSASKQIIDIVLESGFKYPVCDCNCLQGNRSEQSQHEFRSKAEDQGCGEMIPPRFTVTTLDCTNKEDYKYLQEHKHPNTNGSMNRKRISRGVKRDSRSVSSYRSYPESKCQSIGTDSSFDTWFNSFVCGVSTIDYLEDRVSENSFYRNHGSWTARESVYVPTNSITDSFNFEEWDGQYDYSRGHEESDEPPLVPPGFEKITMNQVNLSTSQHNVNTRVAAVENKDATNPERIERLELELPDVNLNGNEQLLLNLPKDFGLEDEDYIESLDKMVREIVDAQPEFGCLPPMNAFNLPDDQKHRHLGLD